MTQKVSFWDGWLLSPEETSILLCKVKLVPLGKLVWIQNIVFKTTHIFIHTDNALHIIIILGQSAQNIKWIYQMISKSKLLLLCQTFQMKRNFKKNFYCFHQPLLQLQFFQMLNQINVIWFSSLLLFKISLIQSFIMLF